MKWSDIIPAKVVSAIVSGDYLMLLRVSDGADGSKLIETDDFLNDTPLTGTTTVETLGIGETVIAPVVENTMSGDVTLVATDKTFQYLDPDGTDRIVTLPTPVAGMCFVITHAGSADTITVKDDGGATLGTLSAGDFTTLIYSGSDWRVH